MAHSDAPPGDGTEHRRVREPRREESTDLYEILEVSSRASHDVIQAAYRVLARNAHPDRNPGSDAEHRIRLINSAYEILGDPALRVRYDLECARARRHERIAHPTDFQSVVTHQRTATGAVRPRALQVQPTASSKFADDRFPVASLQAVVLLVAVVAFSIVVLMLVWISLDSILTEEKMGSLGKPAVYTRILVDGRPLDDAPSR
jgi:DnaJ domain